LQPPALPDNEARRLAALRHLEILDTSQEKAYDRLMNYAARRCGVPIAAVSLIDANRQWFKARVGLDACETSRDISFCGHAILQQDVFVVTDALQDARFADNPLVTGEPYIRFYAGAPIIDADGLAMGTICVIDTQPRTLTEAQLDSLQHVAESLALLLTMHQTRKHLDTYRASLEAFRESAEEGRILMVSLMTRMMRPDRLDLSAMDYWMQPADTSMGGDLVAAARSPHGRYYVMLADATGHGLPAAVNLLPITKVFYTMVAKSLPPGLIVEEMNRTVRDQSPVGRFVAALLLCFDGHNRTVEVWNGGIPVALLLGADGRCVRRFAPEHLPLGLEEKGLAPQTTIHQWQASGSQFFACTDGLSEAHDPAGEPLGEGAIAAALADSPRQTRLARVRQTVERHMTGTAAHDDITALLVEVDQVGDPAR